MLEEDRLRCHYRAWRRTLHKAKDYRVKVLHVLAGDGNGEASGLLSEPARAYKAERCRECAGCLLMLREKACGQCNGCKGGRGCEEHHRRCRDWPRIANTFHSGSVVTSISSQFDLLTADLSKYEATLEALRELDLELEEDMDQLAPGSASRTNPRFSQEGRTRELDDERNHLARLSMMLQRHGELATRLQEVAEAEDEPQVAVATEFEEEANPLTGTQTSRQLIQMFNLGAGRDPGTRSPPGVLDDGEERLSTVQEASLTPSGLSDGGWSLTQHVLDPDDPVARAILQPLLPADVEGVVPGITATTASAAPTVVAGAFDLPRLPEPGVLRPRTADLRPEPRPSQSPSLRPGVPAPSRSCAAKGTQDDRRRAPAWRQRWRSIRTETIAVE